MAIRLQEVLARCDPAELVDAGDLLGATAHELGADEHVEHLVLGWVRGTRCVVARTDRRLLIVIDRFPEPVVQSVPISRVRVSSFGPPGAGHVSLAIVDRRRLLEVTGVRQLDEAASLTGAPDARRSGRSQYF